MEREGGRTVSQHQLEVVFEPGRVGEWQSSVLNLHPYPISRGRWFVKPLYLERLKYPRAGDRHRDDDCDVRDAASGDARLVRLVCDQARGCGEKEFLYLAGFDSRVLAHRPLCFPANAPSTPLKNCEDRLVFRLLAHDPQGLPEDVTHDLLSSTGAVLGIELVQLRPLP